MSSDARQNRGKVGQAADEIFPTSDAAATC